MMAYRVDIAVDGYGSQALYCIQLSCVMPPEFASIFILTYTKGSDHVSLISR